MNKIRFGIVACLLVTSVVQAEVKLAPGKWSVNIPATKGTLIVAPDGTQTIVIDPTTVVTVTGVAGGTPIPDPNPQPIPTTTFSKVVSRLTTEALTAGGTKTTGAGISSVYSLVSDSVADGSIPADKAIEAVSAGTSLVMTRVTDKDKWIEFRKGLGDAIDKMEQDGTLNTNRVPDKAKYASMLKEVATSMNSVTGFNGSLTVPQQLVNPNAGIFGDINIQELIALIKMLIDFIKLFKGLVWIVVQSTIVLV